MIFREMLGGCIILTVLSVFVMALSYYGLLSFVKKYMADEEIREIQSDQVMAQLQNYIARQNLSTTNVREIKRWQVEKGVQIHFMGTKQSIEVLNGLQKDFEDTVIDLQIEKSARIYEIKFRDQMVMCYPELKKIEQYYKGCFLLSAVLSLLFFALGNLMLWGRRIRYVIRLQEEISNLQAGDLTSEITVEGRDELAQIGKGMNELRSNILKQIQTEREAITANHELITAMSHDLRTPLTRQIGYLEILSRKKYQNEEELYEYIEKARSNAFLMKDTTDKLFRYFLAFGKQEMKEKQMEVEGKTLFNAALKEQIAYIISQGFVVSFEEISRQFRLRIDADEFTRVFDNIFHNMKKYGDPTVPVYITHICEDGEFVLMIQNGIRKDGSKVESTKVGLKIVEKIMKSMDGSMEVMNDGQYFVIQLVFKLL